MPKEKYDFYVSATKIQPIGVLKWAAKAKIKKVGTSRIDDLITLGECLGKTKNEAEAKAEKAAEKWIKEKTD